MECFTNTELEDMHMTNGLAEGSSQATERLYRKRYPQRHAPELWMFANLHLNSCEYRSLQGNKYRDCGPRATTSPYNTWYSNSFTFCSMHGTKCV
ncbi:hypothetical protein TNCV_2247921 [Trichonephila clavipes]|nr:hypothetical protein TNCV_2247921 [Trichonephila clavipes]